MGFFSTITAILTIDPINLEFVVHTYEWQEKFNVHVEGIDMEHKNLITSLNKLIVAQHLDRAIILKLADEVILYAEFHFLSEENLMYLLHYPNLGEHAEEHRRLIKQLKNKREHLEESLDALQDFVNFLVSWFIEHTQTTDKQLGQYINQYHADPGSPEQLIKSLEVRV